MARGKPPRVWGGKTPDATGFTRSNEESTGKRIARVVPGAKFCRTITASGECHDMATVVSVWADYVTYVVDDGRTDTVPVMTFLGRFPVLRAVVERDKATVKPVAPNRTAEQRRVTASEKFGLWV